MGQQQQAVFKTCQPSHRSYQTTLQRNSISKIENEGILKLYRVPFKNCIEIETDSEPLFLENVNVSLKDLLENRLYTNKLFPLQNISRLIENVTYTLAFLQQKDIVYKDLSPENIFYDDNSFKILPNDLITETTYEKFVRVCQEQSKQLSMKDFVAISPEMLIAHRCQEKIVSDSQILHKSNIFQLGLIFLEAAVLLPSNECFDIQNFEILDEVICERIELVKDYYNEGIACVIANMLDYDYMERMDPTEASIFVNRQLSTYQNHSEVQSPEEENAQSYGKRSDPQSRLKVSSKQPNEPQQFKESETPVKGKKCTLDIKPTTQTQVTTHNRPPAENSKQTLNSKQSELNLNSNLICSQIRKRNKTNQVYMGNLQVCNDEGQESHRNPSRGHNGKPQGIKREASQSRITMATPQQSGRQVGHSNQNFAALRERESNMPALNQKAQNYKSEFNQRHLNHSQKEPTSFGSGFGKQLLQKENPYVYHQHNSISRSPRQYQKSNVNDFSQSSRRNNQHVSPYLVGKSNSQYLDYRARIGYQESQKREFKDCEGQAKLGSNKNQTQNKYLYSEDENAFDCPERLKEAYEHTNAVGEESSFRNADRNRTHKESALYKTFHHASGFDVDGDSCEHQTSKFAQHSKEEASLSRIKGEIEKSRRLIEDFRNNNGGQLQSQFEEF